MKLRILPELLSVCKLTDASLVRWDDEFVFLSKTDDELSLVCTSKHVPPNITDVEDGWRALKIEGLLDFSLVGILAGIATVLAEKEISVFVVSTFNTDYILVKEDKLRAAADALRTDGYKIT